MVLTLGGWPAVAVMLGLIMLGITVYLIVHVRKQDLRRDVDGNISDTDGEDTF